MYDDRFGTAGTVSVRAVVQHGDEDVTEALLRAGIFDPVSVPVVFGEEPDVSQGLLGDGVTPNLRAVLAHDVVSDFEVGSNAEVDAPKAHGRRDGLAPRLATRTMPPAFGWTSLAPVPAAREQSASTSLAGDFHLPTGSQARSEAHEACHRRCVK
jgi:hypothetical protein